MLIVTNGDFFFCFFFVFKMFPGRIYLRWTRLSHVWLLCCYAPLSVFGKRDAHVGTHSPWIARQISPYFLVLGCSRICMRYAVRDTVGILMCGKEEQWWFWTLDIPCSHHFGNTVWTWQMGHSLYRVNTCLLYCESECHRRGTVLGMLRIPYR